MPNVANRGSRNNLFDANLIMFSPLQYTPLVYKPIKYRVLSTKSYELCESLMKYIQWYIYIVWCCERSSIVFATSGNRGYPAKRTLPAMLTQADRALLAGYPRNMPSWSIPPHNWCWYSNYFSGTTKYRTNIGRADERPTFLFLCVEAIVFKSYTQGLNDKCNTMHNRCHCHLIKLRGVA